ncbi:MAG: TnsD family Tn7-like transposition protein [Niameybacter sp.]
MSILRPYPGEIFYSWVVRMYALYTRGEESWLREMFGMNTFGIYKVKKFKDIYLEQAYRKYRSKLRERGYFNERLIDTQSLKEGLLEYFGENVLDNIGVSISQNRGWISSITQKQQAKLKLIHHLAMIKFLFGSMENFLSYEVTEYELFGRGPWPCLNPFCKLYRQDTIDEAKSRKKYTDSYIVGAWQCKKCGFMYTRQGPDPNNINKGVFQFKAF